MKCHTWEWPNTEVHGCSAHMFKDGMTLGRAVTAS